MNAPRPRWRDLVNLIEERLQPEKCSEEIGFLLDQGYTEDQAVSFLGGLIGHYLVEMAGLSATLDSAPPVALRDLTVLAGRLASLHLDMESDMLPWRERSLYHRLLREVQPLYAALGPVMKAVMLLYLTDAYDLATDPNALLREANLLVGREPDTARRYVALAGVLHLRGKPLWWGWVREADESLRPWLALVISFTDSLTQGGSSPLQPAQAERTLWRQKGGSLDGIISALQEGRVLLAEIQLAQPSTPRDPQVEELVYGLFERGNDDLRLSLRAFERHREAVIPFLIALVQDVSLWGAESLGEGWAPVRAVDMLGKLKAVEAIEPLLQLLPELDEEDALRDQILVALEEVGDGAVAPLLNIMRYSRDRQLKFSLAALLGRIGRGNEAVYRALLALYEEAEGDQEETLAVLSLAALRDSRTVSILHSALNNGKLHMIDQIEVQEALDAMESGASSDTEAHALGRSR